MFNRLKLLSAFLPLLAGSAMAAPAYDAAGDLIPPADYREWVFLSAGLDMSYSENAATIDHSVFDNVFVDPASWAAFKQTGHWPDKTMMVLEIRGADSHGSINKHGQYQTEQVTATEIHIRDEARFKGGWGFFRFDGTAPAKLIPYEAGCYACHQAHAAADTTFTQFYPTAKPIAVKAGNFRDE